MNQIEKYKGFRAELAIAETFEDIKIVESKAAAVAEFAKINKVGIDEQNEWGEFRTEIIDKKGEWLGKMWPHGGDGDSKLPYGKLRKMPATFKESSSARLINKEKELKKKAIARIKKEGKRIVTPSLVATEIRKEKKKIERVEKAEAGKKVVTKIDFRLGDFEQVFSDLPDGSIDCIITDPPYPLEFIECWTKLSRFAKRVLKPNGFCIAYSGQMNLPEVIKRMSEHLNYYWTFCVYLPGATQIVNGVNIMCRWKPVLIYQNGKKKLSNPIQDYFISEQPEKGGHDWQQSISGVTYLIEMFTNPGDKIFEPFAGSGTTLIAAIKHGRQVLAAEIDETTYNIAKSNL